MAIKIHHTNSFIPSISSLISATAPRGQHHDTLSKCWLLEIFSSFISPMYFLETAGQMSLQHQAPMQAFTSLGLLTETAGGGEYYHNKTFFLYMSIQNSCKFHQCMRKRQRKAESRHTHSFHTLAKLGLVFSYKTECVWQSEITESTTYYAGSVSKYVSSSFSICLKFKCRTPFCLPYLLFLKYQWHLKSCIHLTTVYRMSDNCNPLFHMRPIYALSVDSDQQSVER